MSDEPSTTSAPAVPPGKAFTPRALISGFVLVLLFAIVTPINDWMLKNTFLYSQHLAVGVFLFVVLMGAAINPLLGRFRYRAGEMMVMVAMLLVLGGVASSGLSRTFTPVIAGPAKLLPGSTELAAYIDDDGKVRLPQGPYIGMPEEGLPDINDPEYRYVIDGFHQGLGVKTPSVSHRATVTWTDAAGVTRTQLALSGGDGGGDEILQLDSPLGLALLGQRAGAQIDGPDGVVTVVAVAAPSIPWGVWAQALLAWAPLLGSAFVCFIAMAALVRHQWVHNERLTYPIANVIVQYVQDPEKGQRFSPIFLQRAFWIAFVIVTVWLLTQPLGKMGWLPFQIPVTINLSASFGQTAPFNLGYDSWGYLTPTLFFSIIGLVFFLPADISFSVWFCFIIGNVIYALARHQGMVLQPDLPSKVSMGGWFVECLLILWIGRTYYLRLLRAAFAPTEDPLLRELRPITWAFLLSALGLVLAMTALGAYFSHACIAALCYLGIGLVLGRLVAEAGIPFMQTPVHWNVSGLIYSLTGFSAPMAALIPLTMLAQSLCADPREHLVPFATNAEYLGEKAGVRRVPWTAISLVVVAVGTVVAGSSMLWCAYYGDGHQALDTWWRPGPFMGSLGPVASSAQGGTPVTDSTYWAYGAGATATAGLGIARLAWSWWPVHPIGVLVMASYPVSKIWFSFFIGWLMKVLVMRYGGMQLYGRLKPAALGLIAAEAAIAGIFLVIGLVAGLVFDYKLPFNVRFLPG